MHSDPRSQLTSLSLALRTLHKTLVESESQRFGEVGNAFEHLQLLATHPQFAWLHPLSALLVELDERLSDKGGVDAAALQSCKTRIEEQLALGPEAEGEFTQKYRDALQASTEVAAAHGTLRQRLAAS